MESGFSAQSNRESYGVRKVQQILRPNQLTLRRLFESIQITQLINLSL